MCALAWRLVPSRIHIQTEHASGFQFICISLLFFRPDSAHQLSFGTSTDLWHIVFIAVKNRDQTWNTRVRKCPKENSFKTQVQRHVKAIFEQAEHAGKAQKKVIIFLSRFQSDEPFLILALSNLETKLHSKTLICVEDMRKKWPKRLHDCSAKHSPPLPWLKMFFILLFFKSFKTASIFLLWWRFSFDWSFGGWFGLKPELINECSLLHKQKKGETFKYNHIFRRFKRSRVSENNPKLLQK